MPNPAANIARMKQSLVGLARDFWKDGPENLFGIRLPRLPAKKPPAASARPPMPKVAAEQYPPRQESAFWRAAPGEISEKMWGEGYVVPGAQTVNSMLITPLGLTKEMNVLDLSAGLGGLMRRIVEDTGTYVTGLEPDAAIAERGMQLSLKAGKSKRAPIAHYDPAKLTLDRTYDCVIVRETFYRVPNRAAILAVISKHTKAQAQIAFTDYVLEAEHREHPAILAWRENEKLADPIGLVETAEAWAKANFSLRIHEDLSDYYKTEIMAGLKRFNKFLATGVRPDKETGDAILRRLETWQRRLGAIDAGMKFYRFYGVKR